jgi:hypothetical protein
MELLTLTQVSEPLPESLPGYYQHAFLADSVAEATAFVVPSRVPAEEETTTRGLRAERLKPWVSPRCKTLGYRCTLEHKLSLHE